MSLFRRRHGNCLDEGLQRDAPLDIEITDYPWPNAPHKFKTNMSLNLYPHSKIEDLYAAAACGIIIQFGVLAFSGLTVYYPIWNLKFQKKGQPVQSHAYPLMATGTCLLVIGMIMCSAVVDHCTMEEEWVISSSIRDQKQKAHILWLQVANPYCFCNHSN
jgi:hypothetical protein